MGLEYNDDQQLQFHYLNENYGVSIFSTQGDVLDINERFLKIFGYKKEQVIGKNIRDLWDKKLVENGECDRFWQSIIKGETKKLEITRIKSDGTPILLKATYTPLKDANGDVVRVLISGDDITKNKKNELNWQGQVKAICRSQAVIEFDIDGMVLDANENFLETMHYELNEIKGKHHSLFCEPSQVNSTEYKIFWDSLKDGKYNVGEFKRLNKYNQVVWLQASYNPIYGIDGKVIKIIKFATNITKEKEISLYHKGQIEAISKVQAIIEFDVNGIVLNANENFLDTFGYTLEEIQGKPHSIFCEEELLKSDKYKKIWSSLKNGHYHAGQFKRVSKNGMIIWIQASYNPIYGVDGKISKIVKFAYNITREKELDLYHQGQIEAISKSQAIIEFDINGVVLNANQNFLDSLGYIGEQILGKHHSMFCEEEFVSSPEYKKFWDELKRGHYHTGQYKRLDSEGNIIWLQATYNPIYGIDGKVIKIIKFAHDITDIKKDNLYCEGQIKAICRSQAVIEFDINGVITHANNNFLTTMGYTLEDIQGKHHSIFCHKNFTHSKEYNDFWNDLKEGKFHSGQFKRIDKNGNTIFLRASYNPIYGIDGSIVGVVKFAYNITDDKTLNLDNEGKLKAICKSQAVIEFDTKGNILDANENFLKAFKYKSLDEIKGKHHSMFCEEELAKSLKYTQAWRALQNGKYQAGQYKRIDKYGNIVWVQATYNPIYGIDGRISKIVKFAHNITSDKELQLYYKGQIEAINKAQAVIEFDTSGIVLNANENFLKAVDYSLEEIQGKHHSIFCEEDFANSKEYDKFWEDLRDGKYKQGQFKRLGKDGKMIYLQATYNPIYGNDGEVIKIIKFAHDITEDKELSLYYKGQLEAIGKSQAIIEFDAKGNILDANDNFLEALEYHLDEIQGKNHSIFCEEELVKSKEYEQFWNDLAKGIYHAGQYKRISRTGQVIWIQASYNPIYGIDGEVTKIIKFAHNITADKELSLYYKGQLEAIGKAQSVVEFDLNGVILNANFNFLKTFKYNIDEIQNKHHSMFCDKNYVNSKEYKEFWDLLKQGKYQLGQFKRVDKNGKTIWIRATYNPIYGVKGDVIKIVKFAHNITADKELSLYHKGQIDAINRSQAVVEFDLNGTVLSANSNFLSAMGYSLEEIQGKHHSMFCEKDYISSSKYFEFWEKLQKGMHDSGKYLRIGKNGKKVWIRAVYTPILNIENKPIRILKYAHDITELETIKIDKLTGLYNKGKLVSDILPNEINNVAVIDSNEYNAISDFYGFIAGNTLIIQFAKMLISIIKKDFILYRLHNDTFAILNQTLSRDDFLNEIKIILLKIGSMTIDAKVNQLNLTLSCGISSGDGDEIINQASTAHNYAKTTKQSVISYSKDLNIEEKFKDKIFWSRKINSIIKDNKIIVQFQAIYNNKTKEVEKYEVLARALDTDYSIIYPNKFLHIAKTSKQYLNITRAVILQSFEFFQNSKYQFSINITIEDILDQALQEFLFLNIKKYGVGDKLVVEIVESEQINEYQFVKKFIKKLKNLGVKIAIDDFGSGYSNFEYLLELNTDFVKIDGGIVSKVCENDYSIEIIRSIVSFCKKVGIKTIAEFVSDKDILDKMIELGVDYSQGFYIGKPQDKLL